MRTHRGGCAALLHATKGVLTQGRREGVPDPSPGKLAPKLRGPPLFYQLLLASELGFFLNRIVACLRSWFPLLAALAEADFPVDKDSEHTILAHNTGTPLAMLGIWPPTQDPRGTPAGTQQRYFTRGGIQGTMMTLAVGTVWLDRTPAQRHTESETLFECGWGVFNLTSFQCT